MKKNTVETGVVKKAEDFLSLISNIKVFEVDGDTTLKANVTIEFANVLAVSGFKLIETATDIFITFPSIYNSNTRKSYPNAWLIDYDMVEKSKINDALVNNVRELINKGDNVNIE